MVQTFSYIIQPSLVMDIVPWKKETRSNSRLFRDRKVPKQPTSQRAGAEAVSNYLAGRDGPPAGLFYFEPIWAGISASMGCIWFGHLYSINCRTARYRGSDAGCSRRPHQLAAAD